MENIITNHLSHQQQAPSGQQQFVIPVQPPKYVVNVNHTNNLNVNHGVSHQPAVSHQVNTNINHVVNNQNPNLKTTASTVQGNSNEVGNHLVNGNRISELVKQVDPNLQLDEDVEETLQFIVEDFVDNVINASCKLAKHRHVPTIEVKDVQLYLEKNYKMWLPGFGTDELRPYKRASVTEAHKQRLSLIRRATKKN